MQVNYDRASNFIYSTDTAAFNMQMLTKVVRGDGRNDGFGNDGHTGDLRSSRGGDMMDEDFLDYFISDNGLSGSNNWRLNSDINGRTALHYSILLGHMGLISFCIRSGMALSVPFLISQALTLTLLTNGDVLLSISLYSKVTPRLSCNYW